MIARFAALFLLAAFAAGCTTAADSENSPAIEAAEQAGQRVGEVIRIKSGTHADLVIINAGYGRNIRPGMQLSLSRQGKAIASLVVAEATQESAAALILDLTPNETVKAGDSAKVKTVH